MRPVCVITGASSGIGEQTAIDMARDGYAVVLVARREERLREVHARLDGEEHSLFVADVSARSRVEELADFVRDTYGRCDVLVNNAGFGGGGAFKGRESIDHVRAMIETNFLGAVNCTGELLALLESSAPSTVVNVASIAGRVGLGNSSGYSASKFALVGWSEGLAYELEPRGVKVALVEPGPIPTEGFPQSDLRGHPILRFFVGSTEDVSRAIRKAVRGRARRHSVPRFYRLASLPQMVVPPFHRWVMRTFINRRA